MTLNHKYLFIIAWLLCFIIECTHTVIAQGNQWVKIDQGITLNTFNLTTDDDALIVLRIDPNKVQFELCSSSAEELPPLTLMQWVKSKKLLAGINASMYLPDYRTSTGYMRQGAVLNNGRMARKFGAFFVANPDRTDLPKAAILERETQGLREKLSHYHLVIQNYRLINSARQILWPKIGQKNTIAAVASTEQGDILFIYSMLPTTAHELASRLLQLPLAIGTTMYVEGGVQAGLYVNHPSFNEAIFPYLPFFLQSPLAPQIPNVIGIKALHN